MWPLENLPYLPHAKWFVNLYLFHCTVLMNKIRDVNFKSEPCESYLRFCNDKNNDRDDYRSHFLVIIFLRMGYVATVYSFNWFWNSDDTKGISGYRSAIFYDSFWTFVKDVIQSLLQKTSDSQRSEILYLYFPDNYVIQVASNYWSWICQVLWRAPTAIRMHLNNLCSCHLVWYMYMHFKYSDNLYELISIGPFLPLVSLFKNKYRFLLFGGDSNPHLNPVVVGNGRSLE